MIEIEVFEKNTGNKIGHQTYNVAALQFHRRLDKVFEFIPEEQNLFTLGKFFLENSEEEQKDNGIKYFVTNYKLLLKSNNEWEDFPEKTREDKNVNKTKENFN